MKLSRTYVGIVSVVLGIFALTPMRATAQTVPTVHRQQAESLTARSLREIPGWIYAGERYLDCRHGKIDRTRWRCRFGWYRHGVCHLGRSQVYGESYGYNGQPLFGTAMRWRHYPCS